MATSRQPRPGLQHEAVEAVGFGQSPEQGEQGRLDEILDLVDLDRSAGGALQGHVVEPHPVRQAGGDHPVGALVDHPEAEVFQQGHPVGERQRQAAREDLEVDAGLVVAVAAVEVHGPRARLRELLEKADVLDGLLGPEGLPIGGAEGVRIAGRQGARPRAADGVGELIAQGIAPGADDAGDALLQGLLGHLRRLALVAADDVVGARQGPFRIGRVGRRHAALVDAREELPDADAHAGVVAVLRHEDEHRHEAVELVGAGQRPHAGALRQVHDVDGEVVERLLVDLEQLVAGIALEHVEERAARIARRIEAGAGDDLRHLVAKIRHLAGGVGVGARGEEADDAQFALELAVAVEQLDADIVEMGAAVHPGLDVRLGDDERLRARQEIADFRGHRHELAAAPEHAHGGVAQDAQPCARHRIGGGVAGGQPVLAQPQEGEVVPGDPVDEGDGLVHLVVRQRRGVEAVVVNQLRDPGAHAGPVVHRHRHVLVHPPHGLDEAGAGLGVVDAGEMDMDEALAPHPEPGGARGLAHEADQGAPRVPLHGQDRVRHEKRLIAAVHDLGQGRVEQERHVVVDDLQHRHVAAAALALDLHVEEAHVLALPGAGGLEVLVGLGGERRQGLRRVGGEILRGNPPVEIPHEAGRNGRVAGFQHGDGLGRQFASAGRRFQLHARILAFSSLREGCHRPEGRATGACGSA
jgi:hypothetical protein